MVSIALEFFLFLSTNHVQTTSIFKKYSNQEKTKKSIHTQIISVVSLFNIDVSSFNTVERRNNTVDLGINTGKNNFAGCSFRKCFLLAS